MKQSNIFIIILMCCATPFLTVLRGQTYFSKKFTTGSAGASVNVLPDGYLLTGNFSGSDIWMIKTDAQGNEIQKRYYPFTCGFPDGTLLDNSRVFIAALANVNDTAGVCLVRMDTNGDTLWTKKYRKIGCEEVSSSIIKSHDGNLVIAVNRLYFKTRQRELLVYKVDTSGNILSEKVLYGLRNLTRWTSMRYANNEYYFSYYYAYDRTWSSVDGAIMKTDTNFVTTFYKSLGAKGAFADYETLAYFLPLQNKQSAFVWLQDSTNGAWRPYFGQTATAILNFDSLGQRIKNHYFFDTIQYPCVRTAESVRTMRNGDIVGVGKVSGNCVDGRYRGWIFRMSPNGKLKWERIMTDTLYYPSYPYVWFLDFKETPQNDLIISGLIIGTNPQFHPLLIKVDSNGCFDNRRCDSADVSVSIAPPNVQQKIKLSPNPSTGNVTLDWDDGINTEGGIVQLFNVLGQMVFQQKIQSLDNRSQLELNLPSGMYQIRMNFKENKVFQGKVMIVK